MLQIDIFDPKIFFLVYMFVNLIENKNNVSVLY